MKLVSRCWESRLYMDTRLTRCGRSSPDIFKCLADAVKWIIDNLYEVPYLLDGFLSTASQFEKGKPLWILAYVFYLIEIPLAKNKIVGPFTTLEFPGIT